MHETDAAHGAVFAHHLGHVVGFGAAQASGAQAQAVGGAVHQSQEAVQVFLAGDDAGQAEDGIGWVVRMNGHHNAALLGHGNDLLEEFLKVFPQAFLTDGAVGVDEFAHLLLGVAGIPAGQMDVVLQRVKAVHLVPVHHQAGGAVRRLFVQLRARPVEHGHKIIRDALYAVLGAATDVFAVHVQQLVHIVAAEFNVLVHGDAFDNIEHKAVGLALGLHLGQALLGPHLAGLHIVHSGNDAVHARDLRDVLQRNGVGFAIPAE